MVALVGMATAYSESTLAQLFKVKNEDGQYRGGPAFYIARGLGAPWAAVIFSIALIISFGLVFNAVQANSIAGAVEGAFGLPPLVTGLVIAALTGIVIFGGIRKIAKVAEVIVPFMAGIYLLLAVVVLIMNFSEVPGMLALHRQERVRPRGSGGRRHWRAGCRHAQRRQARSLLQRGRHGLGAQHRGLCRAAAAPPLEPGLRPGAWASSSTPSSSARRPH